jgi:hypothetical protein
MPEEEPSSEYEPPHKRSKGKKVDEKSQQTTAVNKNGKKIAHYISFCFKIFYGSSFLTDDLTIIVSFPLGTKGTKSPSISPGKGEKKKEGYTVLQYPCPLCKKVFSKPNGTYRHIRDSKDKTIVCTYTKIQPF